MYRVPVRDMFLTCPTLWIELLHFSIIGCTFTVLTKSLETELQKLFDSMLLLQIRLYSN